MDNATLDALTLENDERAIIGRLAELSPLKYDKKRSAAARELGVSVGALDRAVKEARAARSDTKGQGRPLELPLIEPWHLPVNGAELLDEISAKRLDSTLSTGRQCRCDGIVGATYSRFRLLQSFPATRNYVARKGLRQDNGPRCAARVGGASASHVECHRLGCVPHDRNCTSNPPHR